MPESFLPISKVIERTSYARASIYRMVKAGVFPAPVVLSVGTAGRHGKVGWRQSQVDDWIASKIGAQPETLDLDDLL